MPLARDWLATRGLVDALAPRTLPAMIPTRRPYSVIPLLFLLACCNQSQWGSERERTEKGAQLEEALAASQANEKEKQVGDKTPTKGTSAKIEAKPQLEARPQCQTLCKISQQLKCSATHSECLLNCEQMFLVPTCQRELEEALSCFAEQAAEHWDCAGPGGMPELHDGLCGDEQRRMANCMSH